MAKMVEFPWMSVDGNCFRTEEEAKANDKKIKKEAEKARAVIDLPDSDPCWTLATWKVWIEGLIRTYGPRSILFTDGDYNNVDMKLEMRE